jgi:antitoxin component YwqK of YwqJK toxin-antitoxin module
MKLIKLLFITFPLLIFSQNSVLENQIKHVYHYDKDFKQTDSISSYYYKEVFRESNFIPSGPIVCYTKNGVIFSKTYAIYFEAAPGQNDSIIKNGPHIEYHPNGVKSIIRFFVNNSQIAEEYRYNQSGNLIFETTYLDGMLNGIQKTFYETGELKSKRYNIDGVANGVEIGYYKTGEKKYTRNFNSGIQEGEEVGFYKSGEVLYKMNYLSGTIDGNEVGYDTMGNTIYIKNHYSLLKTDKIDSKLSDNTPVTLKNISYFFNSGEIKQEVNYSKGLIDGLSVGYFKSGKKSYVINYKDGLMDGVSETYFRNGDIKSKCYFIKGLKQGKEVVFKQEKKIEDKTIIYIYFKAIERFYDNGLLDGIETGYFSNESIEYTQIWDQGLLNGEKVKYHFFKNGQKIPKEKYNFSNGVKQGGYLTFYSSGELETRGEFVDDVKSSKILRYYKNKEIKAEEYYTSGLKSGEWKEYYKSGGLKSIRNYDSNNLKGDYFDYEEINSDLIYSVSYIDNKKHGNEISYFTSCQPKKECNFLNGTKNGEEIEYYEENGKVRTRKTYINGIVEGPILTFYPISGRIKKEAKQVEIYPTKKIKLITEFYDSPGKEIKAQEKYNKNCKVILVDGYYINGRLKFEQFVNNCTSSSAQFKEIYYFDNVNNNKSYEREFTYDNFGNKYGYDIYGNLISIVKYFQPQELPDMSSSKLIITNFNKQIYNFPVKTIEEKFISGNTSKIVNLDLNGNGNEIGYYDDEINIKKYSISLVEFNRQGKMQYYKQNGVDTDYSEKYINDIRVDRKLALVIGNSAYKTLDILKNPVNDATLISSSLRNLGFSVIERLNIKTKDEMYDAIDEFNSKRKDSEINLIYYAGHGISVEGENYLIPTDVDVKSNDRDKPYKELKRKAYGVGELKEELEFTKPNQRNIIILDACRNNPLKKYRGNKGGLSKIDPPKGTIIAFSTSYGSVAEDGLGGNSKYAEILAEKILEKNISINGVFNSVRSEFERLQIDQKPIEQSTLTGEVFLNITK